MSFLKFENEGPLANCWRTEQEDAYNNMLALVPGEAEMSQHHQGPVTDAEYRHTSASSGASD